MELNGMWWSARKISARQTISPVNWCGCLILLTNLLALCEVFLMLAFLALVFNVYVKDNKWYVVFHLYRPRK